MIITAPQVAWNILIGKSITPSQEGICRLCGGSLVGKVEIHTENRSEKWIDEFKCAARESDFVCEACTWAQKNRSLFVPFGLGMVISPALGRKVYEDAGELLADFEKGYDPPYIISLKTRMGGPYRKHIIFDMGVSLDPHLAMLTILNGYDVFTVPVDLRDIVASTIKIADMTDDSEIRVFPSHNWHPVWHAAAYLNVQLKSKKRK